MPSVNQKLFLPANYTFAHNENGLFKLPAGALYWGQLNLRTNDALDAMSSVAHLLPGKRPLENEN